MLGLSRSIDHAYANTLPDPQTSPPPHGTRTYTQSKQPEAETLAQVHSILGDHGLLDEHVTSLLACEEGRKDVVIAKKRGMCVWGTHVLL